MINRLLGALVGAILLAPAALAHVTLEGREAEIGTTWKAVLRVPHGCAGAATLKVRVQVPSGVVGVKPMPKAGWELETVTGTLEVPYTDHGRTITEGIKEIRWTGRLLDAHYDEFVFRGQLSKDVLKPGAMLYVPVVQECEGGGTARWIEIPAEGKSADDYEAPAPGIRLVPRK